MVIVIGTLLTIILFNSLFLNTHEFNIPRIIEKFLYFSNFEQTVDTLPLKNNEYMFSIWSNFYFLDFFSFFFIFLLWVPLLFSFLILSFYIKSLYKNLFFGYETKFELKSINFFTRNFKIWDIFY